MSELPREEDVIVWLKERNRSTLQGRAYDVTDDEGRQKFAEWYVGVLRAVVEHTRESSAGVTRIAAERQRQIEIGWTPDHDAEHEDGELVWAAACYLLAGRMTIEDDDFSERCWPWEAGAWKPSNDQARNLEKAGALIAAELDRLLGER